MKIYRKQKGDIGPCETHLGLLTGTTDVRLLPSHRDVYLAVGRQGSYLQGLAGTNSEFIWQSCIFSGSHFKRSGVILGIKS